MGAVINVCIIIITIAVVSLIIMMIIALKDVKRVRFKSEKLMDKIEKDLDPVLSAFEQIAEDIRQITSTARCQIEKVDYTADHINKNLNSIIENWVATVNLLHDAVAAPIGDIAAFIRGLSKGVKFFFDNGREIKNQ